MKVWVKGSASPVSLTQRDYVGEGGEGKTHARGGIAYKTYHDPGKMLALGKIQELQAIQDPNVIRPQALLQDRQGKPIGYTMRFIPDAWALCQLFTRPFRDRNNIDHLMMQKLVLKLQAVMRGVHIAGILLVDANEMNFLVAKNFSAVYGIDADSYQTPHFPTTAIMPSVRDWSITPPHWTEGSDWYAFACVSFQMFTGIHPFKGKHPSIMGLEERMKANISVFNPDVRVPQVAYDFAVIPQVYRDWYEAVFVNGRRDAPPGDFNVVAVVVPTVKVVTGTDLIEVTELGRYKGNITQYWTNGSKRVVLADTLWVDRRQVGIPPSKPSGLAFSRGSVPVLADSSTPIPTLHNLQDQTMIPFGLKADEVSSHDGRLYMRTGDKLYEVVLTDAGNKVIATTKQVANVLPNASHLYPGVIVQNMLGSTFVSLLIQSGASQQVRVKELDEYRVLDAKFDSGVLMVMGEKKGQFDRLVFRFDETFTTYDVREVEDIQPTGLNFIVLDSGVAVCINEDDKLELFSRRKGSNKIKEIEDPTISGDMQLGKEGNVVLFSRGDRLYRMRMR